MVELFVRYRNHADMYDRAVVTVREMLRNLQRELDGLRKDLAVAREETSQAFCREGAVRARDAEVLSVHYNARTELT